MSNVRNKNNNRNVRLSAKEKRAIGYTTPKVRYRYELTNWNDYMANKYDGYRNIRSSFIPVTTINDETYWLLGSFWDYPNDILADFGGSCKMWEPPAIKGKPVPKSQERNRQAPFGCAMIELHEESKGLLDQPILRSLGILDKNGFQIYQGKDDRRKEKVYFMFIPLNYEEVKDIPTIFETLPNPETEKFGPLGFYKETDILQNKFRPTRNLQDFINFLNGN